MPEDGYVLIVCAGHVQTTCRLDKVLALSFPDLTRSTIQRYIEGGGVSVNTHIIIKPKYKVGVGDAIHLLLSPGVPSHLIAQEMPLSIVYEDADLLVINKPAGLVVHPGAGHADSTLVNALLAHCGSSLSGIGGVLRPGIVHRLDKDTSGLLVVAKNDPTHQGLSAQFQMDEKKIQRVYRAFIQGVMHPLSGTIAAPIGRSAHNRQKMAVRSSGGKEAVTHYRTVEVYKRASLVECRLETGRTHQIRVHLSHQKHPIIGDSVYGGQIKNIPFPRQALHAFQLSFTHPSSKEVMTFHAPMPQDMIDLQEKLRTEV